MTAATEGTLPLVMPHGNLVEVLASRTDGGEHPFPPEAATM